MKQIFFLTFLYLFTISNQSTTFKCLYYFPDEFAIYNIKNLNLPDDQPHEELYTLYVEKEKIPGKIWINVCGTAKLPNFCNNDKFEDTSIIFFSEDRKICSNLLTNQFKARFNELIKGDNFPFNGLTTRNTQETLFKVIMKCKNGKNLQSNPEYSIDSDNNLQILSEDACGIENTLAKLFKENKWLFCLVLILLGFIFLFFGGSKWDTIMTLVGFLAGSGGILFIFWAFIDFKKQTSSYIIIGIIAVIVGILIAALCNTFIMVSYFLLGFASGFLLSKYLLLIFQFQGEQWAYYLIMFGSAIVVGGFCLYTQKYVLAILTSLIGAFLVSYCLGFMLGVLGNFFDIWERIRAGKKLEPAFYVFFGLFVLLTIFGWYIQIQQVKEQNREKVVFETEKLLQIQQFYFIELKFPS